MKRLPVISSGGMESIAKLMPRYVDPHTRYTAAKAATTRLVGGRDVAGVLREPEGARVMLVLMGGIPGTQRQEKTHRVLPGWVGR